MTHVFFNPDSVNWSPYLAALQEGRGEFQYFVGTKYQRGGGLLQNVARFLMPVAHNLISSASKEGIAAGSRVLDDLTQGKPLKESLQAHAKQGFENLATKLQQCGKGVKKRSGRKKLKNSNRKKIVSLPEFGSSSMPPSLDGKIKKRRIIDQLSYP